MVLRLLENTFVSERMESVHFYSCPQAKLFNLTSLIFTKKYCVQE